MRNIYSYQGVLPSIDGSAFIAPSADIIGNVKIGKESGVWFNCTVRGDVNEIRIGERTNIQDNTVIHVAELGQGTYLGDNITIGHAALLHACTIEDDAMVGNQACVMDGCLIETGAFVAAGALVTPGKVVRSGEVWAGSPAKKLRDVNDKDLEFFKVNAERYARLAQTYKQNFESTPESD